MKEQESEDEKAMPILLVSYCLAVVRSSAPSRGYASKTHRHSPIYTQAVTDIPPEALAQLALQGYAAWPLEG
jgi:hypothetical protein